MGKRRKTFTGKEETQHATIVVRKKSSLYAVVSAVAVLALLIAAATLCVNLYRESKSLSDELERQKKLMQDLELHTGEIEAENMTLAQRIEDLLNIQNAAPVITSAQIQEQLGSIRELVTQKYIYTNADRGEYTKKWLWGWDVPFSDKSLLVKYDGTIKAGIDLNKVEIKVDEGNRTITVTIPPSQITDHNVPQNTIQTFEMKDGLFNKVTPDDSNELISQGKEAMEEKAKERGLLTEADREAEAIVRAFLSLLPGMDTYDLRVNVKK